MKKIILDCNLMKYPNSGLYYYCNNLGMNLYSLLKESYREKIFFYTPFGKKENSVFPAGTIIQEKKWHKKLKWLTLRDCDIWHEPFQNGRNLLKFNKKTKIVLTVHDLNCLHENTSEKARLESLASTQQLINRADRIVCISDFTKNDLIKNLDTNNKTISVISNGTNLSTINTIPEFVNYEPNSPFLFTIGFVNRKKNFHTLLPLLLNNEFELIIAGKLDDSDYVEEIKRNAENLGVTNRVKIIGPISDSDKTWYYHNCSAFLFPSLAEGFGMPVTEAMHFGKPIFLSNRTALPEIGGDAAFYFDDFAPENMQKVFNEGMDFYQRNKDFRTKIINRASFFSWEKQALEYLNVYRSLM